MGRKQMPNWCSNDISISGSPEVIKKLVEFVGKPITKGEEKMDEPIFSLANIKSSTHDINPETALFPSGGPDDWYHNNINSWGTKWDVTGNVSRCWNEGDDGVTYSFDSAWSPPTPVVERLSEIFPEVSITHTFHESGCDFWGIDKYEGGEKTEEVGGELCHQAWETMGMDCWNCEQYSEDPEEYEDYLYDDCPGKKKEVTA
jgi:hypothetical protein